MKNKSKINFNISQSKIIRFLRLKIMIFILLGSLIRVSASTYSQNFTISISMKNVEIIEVIKEIERQSDFDFFYKNKDLKTDIKIDIDFTNATIKEILDYILENTDLAYSIVDKDIAITKISIQDKNQLNRNIITGKITGIVTDENGDLLPGVNIIIEGTTIGTITNIDGEYILEVGDFNGNLVFSFMGYKKQIIPIEGRTKINITLYEDFVALAEIVAIGYGVQKKSDKTGAVSTIEAAELNGGVLTDPIQGLQGKTAGVLITKKGGDPNGGFSVKIRGASGLNSGTNPLYVVDGVPGVDPTTIAPEDIESFNILKDASSTAIYGARGANGVIIITTKRGSVKKGTQIEFNNYLSIDNVANRLDLLSAEQIRKYAADNSLNLTDGNADTDWQNEVYRQALSQSYNLAIAGRSENTTYRVSITHTDFEGVVIGSEKKRDIGRINITQNTFDNKLTIVAGIAGTIEHNQYQDYEGNGGTDILYQAFQRNPTLPVSNTDGSYYEIDEFDYNNPVAIANDIQNERDSKHFLANFKADFEVIAGLKAGINTAYTRDDSESFYFQPSYTKSTTTNGLARRNYDNFESKLLELTIKYDKVLNSIHSLNAVAGYSFQEDIVTGFAAQGSEPLSDYVLSHDLEVLNNVTLGDISSYKGSNKLISFFGRGVYNYASKYYLTATLRRDGSSKFGANNEWGWFPSASLAWNVKHESFLEDISLISNLKLRIGWGLSGNQEIDRYMDVDLIGTGRTGIDEDGNPTVTFVQIRNANPDLKWESNEEWNLGLDFGVLNSRVSGSLELYSKRTYDLIAEYTVPYPPNRYPLIFANAGEIKNQGFEANLQAFIIDKPNLFWKANLAYATNKPEVVTLSNGEYNLDYMDVGYITGRGMVGVNTQRLAPGMPVGTFYGWEYAGMSEDGKFLFTTAAGGVSREQKDEDKKIIGNALPDFEIGFSNYFKIYKNIDVNFSMRAVVGGDVLNVTRLIFENPNVLPTQNALESSLDYVGVLDDSPKFSDFYLEDGSFLRLDNLTIGYTFNTAKIDWLKNLRVYFTSNNLLTITNYSGLDPEMGYDGLSFGLDQYNVYPKVRSFMFGINLKF
ncbi:MAG: SusC/RagA family TonB-linked outer membrane protein [Bacteroidales bacterium]|nr:SusC/RagA family TonB-linked outer membrane protein [Bacteroidales bacterium]